LVDTADWEAAMINSNAREAILAAAKRAAQAHGYNGLNFRNLAAEVGIKAASVHYHFQSKADLGAAVARRYWEDTKAELDARLTDASDAVGGLHWYPSIFRRSLESDYRICLCSFLSAEHDDLPEAVKKEVQTFAEINVMWLAKALTAANVVSAATSEDRARAIFAAVSGAQLMARRNADVSVFDKLIDSYRGAGLLPL
jgi:TetR/AcrR family transcriptional repressor of nem operon